MPLILNVDDSPAARYARTRILRRAGLDVIEAATARDALEKIRTAKPDLTLLDIYLPDGDGMNMCKAIKADPETRNVSIIHISALAVGDAPIAEGLAVGADAYLSEPVSPHVLSATVKSVLRARRAEQELRVLFDVAAELLTAADVSRVIDRAFDPLSKMLGLSAYLHHRTRAGSDGDLDLFASRGVDQAWAGQVSTLDVVSRKALESRSAVVIESTGTSAESEGLIAGLSFGSYACFPLLTASGAYGTLAFGRREANRFQPEDIAVLRSVCDQIAAATERLEREATLRQLMAESREREAQLRSSEAYFRTIADLVPDLLWSTDEDGNMRWCSRRWMEYTGKSINDVQGFRWTELIHPDDRQLSIDCWKTALASGEPLRCEQRVCAVDGTYRWFLVRSRPVRDDAGNIVRWFGAATDIDEHKSLLDAQARQLDRTHDELRGLAARLLFVQEDERRRLARELHDNAVQKLALVEIELDHVLQEFPPSKDELRGRTERLKNSIAELSTELRHLSYHLHPSVLEHLGLNTALGRLVQDFADRWPSTVDYVGDNIPQAISLETMTALYRITQEALQNITKHAPGSRVRVGLRSRGRGLFLSVRDDGPGFDRENNPATGLGLISMGERLYGVGGKLKVRSLPGKGTAICAYIPMAQAGSAAQRK